MSLPETPGQVAYEAYVSHCGGKSVRGEDLPSYEDQDPAIRGHWEFAAQAVLGGNQPETPLTEVELCQES